MRVVAKVSTIVSLLGFIACGASEESSETKTVNYVPPQTAEAPIVRSAEECGVNPNPTFCGYGTETEGQEGEKKQPYREVLIASQNMVDFGLTALQTDQDSNFTMLEQCEGAPGVPDAINAAWFIMMEKLGESSCKSTKENWVSTGNHKTIFLPSGRTPEVIAAIKTIQSTYLPNIEILD